MCGKVGLVPQNNPRGNGIHVLLRDVAVHFQFQQKGSYLWGADVGGGEDRCFPEPGKMVSIQKEHVMKERELP